MDVLLIEPYFGGSHRAWAEGYVSHSSHAVELLTLPARFWKWRMQGGAATLAERALALDPDQPEARYNLANLYEQESQLDLAIAEFRRVVARRPEFADAHFNLAIALEKVGSRIQSADHFRHYLALKVVVRVQRLRQMYCIV